MPLLKSRCTILEWAAIYKHKCIRPTFLLKEDEQNVNAYIPVHCCLPVPETAGQDYIFLISLYSSLRLVEKSPDIFQTLLRLPLLTHPSHTSKINYRFLLLTIKTKIMSNSNIFTPTVYIVPGGNSRQSTLRS